MSDIKLKGIVIREVNMGEYDKMLTVLTPNLGKISCVAKGARRQNSKILAGSQLLSFCDYNLFKTTKNYYINSCETIETFYDVRIDLEKLTCVSHILKIILDVTDENQNTYKIMQLLLNTFYTINLGEINIKLVVAAFKLRLLIALRIHTNCK